ncbi:uncharacterized protein (DUF433 family) [Rhizobium beringeri]
MIGGEPVFKGTRVPVQMVAAMKKQGGNAIEIVEDYPTLTARMVDFAEIWVAAHPARGRPRKLSEQGLKVKTVKRLPLGKAGAEKPSGHGLVKFLVDECLHTSLVAVARDHGHDCFHVNWLGPSARLHLYSQRPLNLSALIQSRQIFVKNSQGDAFSALGIVIQILG